MTTSQLWTTLGLPNHITSILASQQITNLMPVQQTVIPLFRGNADLVVEAATGSGKTLAFVVPMVVKVGQQKTAQQDQSKFSRVLIVSPTRELCHQTFRTVQLFQNSHANLSSLVQVVAGGSPLNSDLAKLDHPASVLIGTVGRLKEILDAQGPSFLRKIQYLVVDEADRVLKQKGLQEVMQAVPKMRRTYLFSATIQHLVGEEIKVFGLRNASKVLIKKENGPSKTFSCPQGLINEYLQVDSREQKIVELINYLVSNQHQKILVFFNTCASVAFYHKLFFQVPQLRNLGAKAIHGKMKQNQRNQVIQKFVQAKRGVLIATDVVSRGIDFQDINVIIQVDPPVDPSSFVHRIGRTARIGKEGRAVVLLEHIQGAFINYLQQKKVIIEEGRASPRKYQFQWLRQKFWEKMCQDQGLILRSKQAFVSFVRAFKQHQLKYIFQFQKLDLGHVANSFFLFRVPRVRQILGKTLSNFVGTDLNPNQIPFKNKNQQQMILKRKQERAQQAEKRERQKEEQGNSKKFEPKFRKKRKSK